MKRMSEENDAKPGACLLRTLREQQEIIELQSRMIAEMTETITAWEQEAGYDAGRLKERAERLWEHGKETGIF